MIPHRLHQYIEWLSFVKHLDRGLKKPNDTRRVLCLRKIQGSLNGPYDKLGYHVVFVNSTDLTT
jgi:hypothetical protein